ncbi:MULTISPECIES: helix-turn-helix domain-containing protein [Rhodomicrobium]|uniref:GlxA family transcriptional regulator n=1 Tax=Rhodomicrobium TaxID=1068 RepID=UPI000B4AE35F|nr:MULTISPECIES: helix-turn-helix domain-containing protein [Rhodomicrobium]
MNAIIPANFTRPREIAILALELPELLDIAGPGQVFASANSLEETRGAPYRVAVYSEDGGMIETASGVSIAARPLAALSPHRVDTLIVAAGRRAVRGVPHRQLSVLLAACAQSCRRICAVDAGAFPLASSGLLRGIKATTHWRYGEPLRQQYPDIKLDCDVIFSRDGAIWTAAGGASSIDLSLALVEEDLGHLAALTVAKSLVVFLKRPGGQSQLSAPLSAQIASATASADERFIALHAWLSGRLTEKIGVEQLARFVGMSARNFYRSYTANTGMTPAKAMERLRLEAACRELTGSASSLKRVAMSCGFGSEERMRRAFLRHHGISPAQYRAQSRDAAHVLAS